MTGIDYPFFESFFQPCECCKPKFGAATTSTGGHKWTKKEIEEEILYLAEKMANAKWYERGDLQRQLKHWTEKLEKYKQFKEEFK